ncbi:MULTISPECIES: PLP-dependent aminotransferase family protein [unclassified Acinetobacter]|uniref:MocR-like pyridoxine biosynthesis transcription factor PdxR n=1 Tax=unclassified Acinetobacter TaxID=196816 RepID=UPI0029345D4D|nr:MULTISPECIES: PLP-dependent aminotransferase family protein [unclassified Acinetobacter]WOE32893.1 PLP-dependent aminotransferase family protein [Acinetobacter sp. SAAs470]WOE38370.1 PLP-dependent aminotransferase family protein [Acinetobacter sp. SAAs474]
MRSLLGDYLLQRLQQDTDGTLQIRLFRCLRNAIIEGILAPQIRLPASRDLAKEIKVSRNTVLSAYEQLQAQGYVNARTGQGTWVADKLPESFLIKAENKNTALQHNKPAADYSLSQRGSYLIGYSAASPYQWGAFVPGVPDVTEFPHHIFSRIQMRLSREPEVNHLIYSNAGGCLELRQELAKYLQIARSVQCDADQIIITEGTHQAIDLVSRALTDTGDEVWIEDPAYWGARNILRMNGVHLRSLPVDQEGIIPDLEPVKPPKLIFVTPSHQYPLGSHLSVARRKQLLAIARQHKSWIVEDDYDSEFRFSGQPYPSLQGLESDSPVIYMGTFSKTIYPALRIGYLVVPKKLFSSLRIISSELYRGGHLIEQKALAEFIREGHYSAHIRRMRLLYSKRHTFLINLIQRYLGPDFLHEYNTAAGLHLILKLPNHSDDVLIASNALDQGIKVRALSQYYIKHYSTRQKGLLMGFACVSEQEIFIAFGVLLKCLRDAGIPTLQP